MMKALRTRSKSNKTFRKILGINFFTGNTSEAVSYMTAQTGLLVVPSAPALKDIKSNQGYREAVLNADLAITDSAYMVLIWNFISRDYIPRVSGLAYLRELLTRPEVKETGATFWIMPSVDSGQRNIAWLRSQGMNLATGDMYTAPFYETEIRDQELLAVLRERRPRHIVIGIGGGTQEPLGLYIKRNVDFPTSIHCIGAAIGFLSGDQVPIPAWADQLYLGWLLRCISNPRRYVTRYWAAIKLLPLMLRYRAELPAIEAKT